MAREPQSLATGQTATIALTSIYTVNAGEVVAPSLVLTNASANVIEASVYINDGSVDFLLETRKIPAGIGKNWQVFSLTSQRLNPLYQIKIQATTTDALNHHLSGSVIT